MSGSAGSAVGETAKAGETRAWSPASMSIAQSRRVPPPCEVQPAAGANVIPAGATTEYAQAEAREGPALEMVTTSVPVPPGRIVAAAGTVTPTVVALWAAPISATATLACADRPASATVTVGVQVAGEAPAETATSSWTTTPTQVIEELAVVQAPGGVTVMPAGSAEIGIVTVGAAAVVSICRVTVPDEPGVMVAVSAVTARSSAGVT
ncbi:hypothetical protein [Actinoplanes sp. NPDC026619]|uniref:hypothetical protein n=1 Tax=Actinoplanes sp. NPDC026619 TaxID=3155798 RepID=UPI0033DF05DE